MLLTFLLSIFAWLLSLIADVLKRFFSSGITKKTQRDLVQKCECPCCTHILGISCLYHPRYTLWKCCSCNNRSDQILFLASAFWMVAICRQWKTWSAQNIAYSGAALNFWKFSHFSPVSSTKAAKILYFILFSSFHGAERAFEL